MHVHDLPPVTYHLFGCWTCQLYTVFVFANGGRDLEHCVLNSYDEARSVLLQVTPSLHLLDGLKSEVGSLKSELQ